MYSYTNLENPTPSLWPVCYKPGAQSLASPLQFLLVSHVFQPVRGPDGVPIALVEGPNLVQSYLCRSIEPLTKRWFNQVIRVHYNLFVPDVHCVVQIQVSHIEDARIVNIPVTFSSNGKPGH